jgi:glycosyltransferase involved in cell wall biosynthesis
MKGYVLSGYPLSKAYRESLEAKVNHPLELVLLQNLRQSGFLGMLNSLRRMSGDCLYMALEDASSFAMLPALQIAGAMTRIRNQFVVDSQLCVSRIRRIDAAIAAAGLIFASADGVARTGISMLRAARLLRLPRAALRANGERVLYLNANLWFGVKAGGSVGHISGVVNGFFREAYDVLFCTAGGRLMVLDEVASEQLEPPRWFGMPWEANYYSFDDRVVRQMAPVARKFKPTFIYQRMSLGNCSGVRLSRRLNIPLVLEYNGSEVWVARNWGRPLKLERAAKLAEAACLRHAHLVVTVSDTLRDDLLARGVEKSRIVTYPNCVDPEIFDPARFSVAERNTLRARYSIEPDATVVSFLGSFGQWHGVPVLAEAIRRLIEDESAWLDEYKVRFMLVGDGVKMPEVRSILGRHCDGKYVRLTGLVVQDAAPLHLAASDILSSPHVPNTDGSRFFGSPTKLFEYMAMGKAIVASDLDQIGDVLRNSLRAQELPKSTIPASEPLALLCKPGSVEQHLEGIRLLVDQPALRTQLGANARAEALRRYTWSAHVRQILMALRS